MDNSKSNQELETILELKEVSELSEKLNEYIKKVKEETGHPVLIKGVQDVGLDGMSSEFKLDPKYILVKIVEDDYYDPNDIKKEKIDQEGIECVIAHEATHGLLIYKKKYCRVEFSRRCNKLEKESVSLIYSMIIDAVANKIIHKNNFQRLPKHYIDNLKDDIKKLQDGKDPYKDHNKCSPIFKNRLMVFDFISAWGILRYFNPGEIDKKTIHKFLKIFQKSCPKQYEEAKKIKEIIRKNGIFTPDGFRKTIEECLELWDLKNSNLGIRFLG